MAYTRTNWVSGATALSADNMNNIEDGIEELKNITTLINTTNSTYNVTTYAYKVGNVVTVTLIRENGDKPSSSGWTTIATLPAGSRPPGILLSYFYSGGTTSDTTIRMRISTAGVIELYSIPQNAQLGGTITFAATQ